LDGDVIAAGVPAACAFIVGNPPYVSTTRLATRYKNRLRARFCTSSGRLDLYTAFMERSLELLADGGRLALITPDKFLTSQTSAPLRHHMLSGAALRVVARFASHRVFADAATVPCVAVFQQGGERGNVTLLQCSITNEGRAVSIEDRSTIPEASLGKAPWHLHSRDARTLIARLEAGHPTVKQLARRVSAGPASGRDRLFVFAENAVPSVEPELLHPAIRGRDIEAFELRDPKLLALAPYRFDDSGAGEVVHLKDFPRAARYLRAHRTTLESRHCVRVWERPWYGWHDPLITELTRVPKILVPDVANSSRFAVDTGRFLPLHSAYYLLPRSGVDLFFLVGVLNSFVAEFIVRTLSPVVKDGFSRYRQQFVAALPVPLGSAALTKGIARAARDADRERVDDLVAELFALSDAEREAVARKIPRSPDGQ